MNAQLYADIEKLPKNLQTEVEHFVGYLLEKSEKNMAGFDFKMEESANQDIKSQKILALMKQMASYPNSFTDIDGVEWQKEQRQDRPLPFRD